MPDDNNRSTSQRIVEGVVVGACFAAATPLTLCVLSGGTVFAGYTTSSVAISFFIGFLSGHSRTAPYIPSQEVADANYQRSQMRAASRMFVVLEGQQRTREHNNLVANSYRPNR